MFSRYIFAIFIQLVLLLLSECKLGVVLWHGMGDTASTGGMIHLADTIRKVYPGSYVLILRTADNWLEEWFNSYFMPIRRQLEVACQLLQADVHLQEGYHLIGISQGGLFVRALAQLCPPPRIGAVISIGGPQLGIFGLPTCTDEHFSLYCHLCRNLLAGIAYSHIIQSSLVQAQYWHDPMKEAIYKQYSQFLSEFNQEKFVNETYAENMRKIQNLVLVRFMNDTILIPGESEWFGYYLPGRTDAKYTISECVQFTNDTLGLRTLASQGKLHLLSIYADHLHFTMDWFENEIVRKFLSP